MRKPWMLVTVFAAALFLGAALSAMGACSSPDGVTPDCQFNVGGNGIVPAMNGCEGFAPCVVDGGVRPAKECCVDDKGAPLTGDALNVCLAGYGVPAMGTTGSSSSGGGGATSSSSSASSSSSGGGDGGV
jgi:uncharacterized membrane protein YgcG